MQKFFVVTKIHTRQQLAHVFSKTGTSLAHMALADFARGFTKIK
jgi:hypothetical protein